MQNLKGILKIVTSGITAEIRENKAVFGLTIVASLIVVSMISAPVFISNESRVEDKKLVLGEDTAGEITPTSTPAPTIITTPTTTPAVVISTPTPTVAVIPTATPTSTSNQNNNSNNNTSNNPTSTPTPTPTSIPTSTPTPTVVNSEVTITINYSGQNENDTYIAEITAGQTAWEVIKSAIGEENLQYTDFGGDLGVFITGFNGVAAAGNQFYEFRVNGESSMIGISGYICNSGDNLEFVLTTF